MKESSKEKNNNILPEINPRKGNKKSQNNKSIKSINKEDSDDKSKHKFKNNVPKLYLKGILNKKKY